MNSLDEPYWYASMKQDSLLFKSLDSRLSLAVGMGLREQIFLLLNHHEIEQRLPHRGTESEEDVPKRLAQARVELEYADTLGVHDVIIVNDELEETYEEFVYRPA